MNKDTYERITLTKGEMNVYDFGAVKLHAYKTNDFINDEVFVIEKNGDAVLIESPCFFDNNRELEAYLAQQGLNVSGVLLIIWRARRSCRTCVNMLPKTRMNTDTQAVGKH